MTKIVTLELFKENMKFSAGHFTIFSATERESLHGHNYQVYCALKVLIEDNGLSFDYRLYKAKLRELCLKLDQTFLLAGQSKFARIEEEGDYLYFHFNQEKIPFLKKDVTVLPIKNVTVEELSEWFVKELSKEVETLKEHHIKNITVKVFSGPGQGCSFSCPVS